MEISVLRTGGIAGVRERLGPIDTSALADDLGDRLEAKVEEMGFFDFPERIPDESTIYDAFQHDITVSDGDRRHSVTFSDGAEERYRRPLGELVQLLRETGSDFEDEPREAG